LKAPDARQFGIKVCCFPGGEEQTPVFYDAAEQKLKGRGTANLTLGNSVGQTS